VERGEGRSLCSGGEEQNGAREDRPNPEKKKSQINKIRRSTALIIERGGLRETKSIISGFRSLSSKKGT